MIQSEKAKQILARSFDGGHVCMENAEKAVEIAEEETLEKAISLIRNDAYAVSFQTMGQYRTALMEEIRKKILQSKLTT